MGTVVVQTPADEQDITAQRIDHLSDNGDRSTFANQDRLDSETFFDGSDRPLHELGIRIDHHSSASMQIDDLDPNSRRGMGCDELSELFANRCRILIRDESKTDFSPIPGRNDCLATLALVSTQ
jgi:hypothetical protein